MNIEYDRKGYSKNVKPRIYFFSGISLFHKKDSAMYDQFCENIGGELARWCLEKKMNNVYEILKNNGEPVVVAFEFSFKYIDEYKKESIAYQFIAHYTAKYFWNKEYEVRFDGSTEKDIQPNQILKLIKAQGEYYE